MMNVLKRKHLLLRIVKLNVNCQAKDIMKYYVITENMKYDINIVHLAEDMHV